MFTDEVEDPYADRTYICTFELQSELRARFPAKTGLSTLLPE